MSSTTCNYSDRDESIIAYVYDELGASERDLFARHLRGCVECRDEVAQFAGVRRQLAAWTPPALESLVASSAQPRSVSERNARSTPGARASGWWAVPAWAQVAAAMLCLGMGTGVGAGLADLRITYGTQGLTIATGRSMARDAALASADRGGTAVATRAEVTALEQQLRSEMAATRSELAKLAQPADQAAADGMMRRVRTLLHDSEQRQQRELALRVAEVARDVQAQRQADLVRIDRTLGVLQNNTGLAVRRQEQLLNSLAVRVSQRQE
jgi:anti-sigma factor RsiW